LEKGKGVIRAGRRVFYCRGVCSVKERLGRIPHRQKMVLPGKRAVCRRGVVLGTCL